MSFFGISQPAQSQLGLGSLGFSQQQAQTAANPRQVQLLAKSSDPSRASQPVTFTTKWEDLHPDSQRLLLQIEERILSYRDESNRLGQSQRLSESAASDNKLEEEVRAVTQSLAGASSAISKEQVAVQGLVRQARELLHGTEHAVRSFIMLRRRFPQPGAAVASSTQEFYSGFPSTPSPFLQHTVDSLERQLAEQQQRVTELEQLLLPSTTAEGPKRGSIRDQGSLAHSVPVIMANLHDFFIHVASQVEALHQQIQTARSAYLAERRRFGDKRDPFLEASRREIAKKEAEAAKTPQSRLHLGGTDTPLPASQPLAGQTPTTLGSSPLTSLFGTAGASKPSLLGGTPSPAFSMPALGSASTPTLFGQNTPPTPSLFRQTAAATSSLFGAPSSAEGASRLLFGAAAPATPPVTSLFGTPAPGTAGSSFFGGATTPSPLGQISPGSSFFGSAAPAGTPGATAPGMFGFGTPTTVAAKPKPRSGRRK